MDKHRRAKRDIIGLFFKDFRRRWRNIQSIYKEYPGEGLVLAFCFTEALGYYRYGFGGSKLSAIEQFIKVLYNYQSNKHFFVIPPIIIERLPLEKRRRTIGREIKREVLEWLKANYSKRIGVRVDLILPKLPKKIVSSISDNEKRKACHLYQISWGGWFYDAIRTAGVHKGYFPKSDTNKDWLEIGRAIEEILELLEKECLEKIKWPHQLPQPDKVF